MPPPKSSATSWPFFTDLLERAYLNTLGDYRLATITFQGETINGSYAQVQSRMAAGKGEVAIEYRLLEQDGRWAVYDVAVDGVSLISNYRSQFNSILKRMSFTLTKAGLSRRTMYQTRHTFASNALAAGESPSWVAAMLGHANPEMLLFRVYARYIPNRTRRDGSAFLHRMAGTETVAKSAEETAAVLPKYSR
jgi:hypothetical protein